MGKETMLGIVRHVLTFAGGLLVYMGWADEGTATAITGAIFTLVGGFWSIWDKVTGRESDDPPPAVGSG